MKNDDFGNRIKKYESIETDRTLIPHLPIYARLDGRSFHTFTKNMKRPYDETLSNVMIETAKYLVKETNALIAYQQSDEISIIWYYPEPQSEPLFSGKTSKINSVLASMCSVKFNQLATLYWPELVSKTLPIFDCRTFNLPSTIEATNALLWREVDATKNAVSMAARAYFSHKQLQNKSGKEMQEMLFQEHNINFNDYPAFFKRGTFVRKVEEVERELSQEELQHISEGCTSSAPPRSKIVEIDMPSFRKVTNREGVVFNKENPVIDEG
jgi:tRNA(His) 5'-end guanylyltransferase